MRRAPIPTLMPVSPTIWYQAWNFRHLRRNSDTTGSYPVTSASGFAGYNGVGSLIDLSGHGRHAIQATTSLRPLGGGFCHSHGLNFYWSMPTDAHNPAPAVDGEYQSYLEATGISIPRLAHSGGVMVDLPGMNHSPILDMGVAANNLEFGVGTSAKTVIAYDGSTDHDTGIVPCTRMLVITWRSTAAGLYIHVNGVAWSGGAISGAGAMTKLRLGSWLDGTRKPMRLYEAVVYDRDIGGDQSKLDSYLMQKQYGTDPANVVVVIGDEMSMGRGSGSGRPWHDVHGRPMAEAIEALWYVFAKDGATIASPHVSTAEVIALKSSATMNKWGQDLAYNLAVVWLGKNDIMSGGLTGAQAETAVGAYCNTLKAAGFKVAVCTLPYFATNNAERQAFNTAVRANYANYANRLADLASGDGDNGASACFCNDQEHFNDYGNFNQAGTIFVTELTAMLARGF